MIDILDRVRNKALQSKIVTAEDIRSGKVVL